MLESEADSLLTSANHDKDFGNNLKDDFLETSQIILQLENTKEMELEQLVKSVQRMTVLYSLDNRDWNKTLLDIIKRWLLHAAEPVLTIFYDCNILTGCLGFPVAPVLDLCYFIRSSNQNFSIDTFHDLVNYGTIHDDVDGCLLSILEFVYAPVFRNFKEWGDNVKQRFCTALDKFLAFLTGAYFKMSGMTVLYVPYVVKQIDRESISYEREFVKNLEVIAVSWATQIRTLLNDKTLPVSNEFISVEDEYEFWLYRFEVLQGLNAQLEQADVQQIIRVLRNTHSVYIKQIDELIYESKHEMDEGMSNIKFLHLLMNPCAEIDLANSPVFVSQLIPGIIHLIRFIWLNSESYNRRDLITGLFRDLSNQIIRFCTEITNVDKILSGSSRFGIKMCNMCIDCCLTYKGMYDLMSKEHGKINNEYGWNLDNAMIFNHVDAFMERLNDVIDICESMIVFGRLDETESIPKPQFGGTSGGEFETTSARVETHFLATLTALSTDSKELILNVNKNEWYEEVIKYRRTVQSMEETVQRLMSNVFQHVCNIEEALETLNILLFYSYRSTIRKTFLRQVSNVWVMFATEIDSTSQMLMDRSKLHESWVPYYASRAVGYHINLERLKWLRNRLNSSEWLPNVSEAAIVLFKYEILRKEFDKEIKKIYDEWQKNCCMLNQKLDRNLIIRSKKKRV